MGSLIKASVVILFFVSWCVSQEPITFLSTKWERTTLHAPPPDTTPIGPVTPVSADTKYFQRKAREQRTDNPLDPNRESMEARSQQMDQAVRESRAPKADDQKGYVYTAEVRNDTGSTVAVIFWEYVFTEIARPSNVVRRQFLCAASIKDGEKKMLSAFSLLGPSDVIAIDSLAKPGGGKLFDEKVQVNRIELSDGTIIQRDNWKLKDVQAAVERAVSKPWGNETCRAL
jgi:hypothetical protein